MELSIFWISAKKPIIPLDKIGFQRSTQQKNGCRSFHSKLTSCKWITASGKVITSNCKPITANCKLITTKITVHCSVLGNDCHLKKLTMISKFSVCIFVLFLPRIEKAFRPFSQNNNHSLSWVISIFLWIILTWSLTNWYQTI